MKRHSELFPARKKSYLIKKIIILEVKKLTSTKHKELDQLYCIITLSKKKNSGTYARSKKGNTTTLDEKQDQKTTQK